MTGGSEYHCGNCPNTECVYNHLKDHIGRARKWNGKELKHVEFTPRSFTEECGCASHPSAQAALRAEGAKQALKKLHDACECIPQKETDRDFDKGFHQAMTLVRGWCK